mmetsp:Transcript_12570/g.19453  ORF Transcript_12570/g.19453 Transcript_12570/m.19453 type:complete len:347 (-) Transcript_12570:87-1127(-)
MHSVLLILRFWPTLFFWVVITLLSVSSADEVKRNAKTKNVAVVTLLTTSVYVPGAEVLAHSLKLVNATGDRVLMYVGPEEDARSDLTEEHIDDLRLAGWNRIISLTKESRTYTECKVSEKNLERVMSSGIARYWGTCSKFAIWTLTDYDAVVYLDADSLVLNNFDFVYNYTLEGYDNFLFAQGTPGCWETPPNCKEFYSAFLLVKPLPHIQQYFHDVAEQSELVNGDIELLNALYKNWTPLPRYTLVAQTEVARPRHPETNEVDWTRVKVYDFSGAPKTKPWVTYKIQKDKEDKYAHGHYSTIKPNSNVAQSYLHPQWIWNAYYEWILDKKLSSKGQTKHLSTGEL